MSAITFQDNQIYYVILSVRDDIANNLIDTAKKIKEKGGVSNPSLVAYDLADKGFSEFQEKAKIKLGSSSTDELVDSFIKSAKSYFYSPKLLQKQIEVILMN